jgi:hypothetical protein
MNRSFFIPTTKDKAQPTTQFSADVTLDTDDSAAVHQRNRSACKRADVRPCRFSARVGVSLMGHFRVPPSRSQAIVPALVNSYFRAYLQVFCTRATEPAKSQLLARTTERG